MEQLPLVIVEHQVLIHMIFNLSNGRLKNTQKFVAKNV